MIKLGGFGGTFDPAHYGHIFLANQALRELRLDRVLVIPACAQPFKLEARSAPGWHRYNMAMLAFGNDDRFSVSDIELKKEGVSYTVDTLREVKELYGNNTGISFILGADVFMNIEKWKNHVELLTDYSFIVGARPGWEDGALSAFIKHVEEVYNGKVTTVSNKPVRISSTEIKAGIKSGEDLSEFLPIEIMRYITVNELY